jgi:hypothetical protein
MPLVSDQRSKRLLCAVRSARSIGVKRRPNQRLQTHMTSKGPSKQSIETPVGSFFQTLKINTQNKDHMPDPLQVLPAEVILRCIEFTTLSGIAALNSTTKAWHGFLDTAHQDAIYSVQARTLYNRNPRSDREVLELGRDVRTFGDPQSDKSFVKYFQDVETWKDFCKRLVLLEKNWHSKRPVVKESVVQVGYDPVWRFKPDFKRRFFVSTSQAGGVCVTDMDDGRMLWRLRREDVRMCKLDPRYGHHERCWRFVLFI